MKSFIKYNRPGREKPLQITRNKRIIYYLITKRNI